MQKIEFAGRKNIVGARVRAARAERGISQGALAAQLQTLGVNIDQQMVSRVERGLRIVTDYELACLCRVLRMPPEALLADALGPKL